MGVRDQGCLLEGFLTVMVLYTGHNHLLIYLLHLRPHFHNMNLLQARLLLDPGTGDVLNSDISPADPLPVGTSWNTVPSYTQSPK